jgi:hypothetical protein
MPPALAAGGDQAVGTDVFAMETEHLVYLGVICKQAGRPETPLLTNLRSKRKGRGGTWADIVLRPQSDSSH